MPNDNNGNGKTAAAQVEKLLGKDIDRLEGVIKQNIRATEKMADQMLENAKAIASQGATMNDLRDDVSELKTLVQSTIINPPSGKRTAAIMGGTSLTAVGLLELLRLILSN